MSEFYFLLSDFDKLIMPNTVHFKIGVDNGTDVMAAMILYTIVNFRYKSMYI